jgi:hypothetical protein
MTHILKEGYFVSLVKKNKSGIKIEIEMNMHVSSHSSE